MALNLGEDIPTLFPKTAEIGEGFNARFEKYATVVVSLDGRGNTDNLADALKMVAAGGTIHVMSGTYTHTATVDLNVNNIFIEGEGESSIIYLNTNTEIFSISSQSFIRISNLYLKGSGNAANTSNHGIKVTGNCKGLRFEHIKFDYIGGKCIYFYTVSGETNQQNFIQNCIMGESWAGAGNHIEFLATGAGADSDIRDNTIFGNIIKYAGTDGILIDTTGNGYCNQNKIIANYIRESGSRGIYIQDVQCIKTLILGNSCIDNVTADITNLGLTTESAHNLTT